jgi:hypothetical protein
MKRARGLVLGQLEFTGLAPIVWAIECLVKVMETKSVLDAQRIAA